MYLKEALISLYIVNLIFQRLADTASFFVYFLENNKGDV